MTICPSLNHPVFLVAPCRMSGVFPDTVLRNEHELKVLKVDDSVNTTFVCEVTNRIGVGRDQITAVVRGEFKPRKQPARARTHTHVHTNTHTTHHTRLENTHTHRFGPEALDIQHAQVSGDATKHFVHPVITQ